MTDPINVAELNYPKRPGEHLPNGAILLCEDLILISKYRRVSIVLCLNPGAVEPFVTWLRTVTSDNPIATGGYMMFDTCSFGHYHRRAPEAFKEYERRIWEEGRVQS